MVIDAARGIEAQTRKLFEVCRLRSVPIVTFVNKVDREGRSPFDLLDEIADQLALDVAPMMWPAGMGGEFEGLWDIAGNRLLMPQEDATGAYRGRAEALSGSTTPGSTRCSARTRPPSCARRSSSESAAMRRSIAPPICMAT
jgi:peptide chain release factor 3